MATFPALCPTERSYTAARWPVRSAESLGGVTSRRLFSDRASRAQLTLTFGNIPDDSAALIDQNHRDCAGELRVVSFPSTVAAGMSSNLSIKALLPGAGLSWHWESPPEVTSIRPGFSTVRCSFVATQDA